MAVPTTLVELAQARETAATAGLAEAQQAVQKAQAGLAEAAKALQDAISQRVSLEKGVSAIRKKLSEAQTAADASAASVELGTALISLREQSAKVLDAEAVLARAKSTAEAAADDLAVANGALTSAKVALSQLLAKPRSTAEGPLAKPPLSTLPADTKKLKTTAPFNKPFDDAKKRIEADIPTKLIERARERRKATQAQIENRSAVLKAAEEARAAMTPPLLVTRAKYDAAQRELAAFIGNAVNRVERAKALLARVADDKKTPLTSAQRAAVSAAAAKGAIAAGEEKKRDDARSNLDNAQTALDVALIKAKLADVDKAAALDANPASDTTLAPLVQARDKAASELATAETAFTGQMRLDLNAWEAAVPDDTWALLADFEEASEIIDQIGAFDVNAAKAKRDAAEKAFVDANLAAEKSERAQKLASAESTRLSTVLKFEFDNRSRRLTGALRGDI